MPKLPPQSQKGGVDVDRQQLDRQLPGYMYSFSHPKSDKTVDDTIQSMSTRNKGTKKEQKTRRDFLPNGFFFPSFFPVFSQKVPEDLETRGIIHKSWSPTGVPGVPREGKETPPTKQSKGKQTRHPGPEVWSGLDSPFSLQRTLRLPFLSPPPSTTSALL